MKKYFAVVGSWGFGDIEKGITVFRFDPETGALADPKTTDPWLSAGYTCYHAGSRTLYAVDEVDNRIGEAGGGGFVRAYRAEADGSLRLLNEIGVLLGKPCYLSLTPEGDYLVVACHASRGCVTRLAYDAKGNFTSSVLYDDAGVVLLSLEADGRIGEIRDVQLHTGLTPNKRQVHAHPHSIQGSPDGNFYLACDKGLDRIYTYRLDREKGKLIPLGIRPMPFATAPRYSAFHPTLPVVYENNEDGNRVYAFRYDPENGSLTVLSEVETGEKDGSPKIMPADLGLHPNGRTLYSANRQLNNIAVFNIAADGAICLRESVDTGAAVRGFCFSPDGRFLLAACERINTVKVFRVSEDGGLTDTGMKYEAPASANVRIIEVEST